MPSALRQQGYDVYVGGVPAYSTLGWFDDPLLSTFIRYPDAQLARLVFHELAHQLVYAKGDTTFNESFAVTVEEEGVRRWLAAEGRSGELAAFRAAQERQREFAQRVKQTRERLEAVRLGSGLPSEEMLAQKRGEWQRLRARPIPAIVPAEPNNAFLASIAALYRAGAGVRAAARRRAATSMRSTSGSRTLAARAARERARAYVRTAGYRRSS